ncbi:tetratricopeptide repeat protein [Myxococcus qinghaiensis]|uniref:tetratricopeptide repeat protein n=1 Tax=Myxococcus qinghaiensis TaxID=2906758 RepID=UPI0020A78761|nr:tetratricopeptide repeat protein [Myxococcus qinghaiensis]MCP3163752.1 tetratricopeptide repeat protein [Myxococcus qinghaiensis]
MSLTLALAGEATAQPVVSRAMLIAAAPDAFQGRMRDAARLYEELEYEQALLALADAKVLAKTEDERADALIYQGLVLADLGQRPKSLLAFRQGLTLRPLASLPVKVSPKVQRDFEDVRQEVTRARAQTKPGGGDGTASVATPETEVSLSDRPERPAQEVPELALVPLHPTEATELRLEPTSDSRSRLRPISMVLAGAGLVAGGVGSYFGLRSQGNIQDARASAVVDTQNKHLDSARGQALAANVLFGVAVTSVAGAVITYFTGSTPENEEVHP